MVLIKKCDRKKASIYIKAFKEVGIKVKKLQEYRKWKNLSDGGRMTVKMDLYEVNDGVGKVYFLSDTLNRKATKYIENVEEIYSWLEEKGYKKEKQFYLEDYGMDLETWNEWNK